MKDLIFETVNQYALGGMAVIAAVAVFLLWRMHRQLKKLNRNLGSITGKIQEYFNVIMEDEVQEEQIAPAREVRREDWEVTKEEREFLLSGKRKERPEDEAVFNAVIQEYFS